MIDRILVPLDGSCAAEAAVAQARILVQTFGAELALLRVVEPGRAGGVSHDSVEWRLQKAEATTYLDALAGPLRDGGVNVTARVSEGRPAEEIIRLIRDLQVDLVCVSAEGQSGPTEFRTGSVAHKVISRAGVSVLIVRPSCLSASALEGRYRRVMVPVDGSQRADWAVCVAASIARAQGAELLMVHAVAMPRAVERLPGSASSARRALVRSHRAAARSYLEAMEAKIAVPDLVVRSRMVITSHVVHTLLRVVRHEDVGLVVMTAHGASGPTPWPYGGVTAGLISHCDAPLLVLQDVPRRSFAGEPTEAASLSTWTGDGIGG